MMREGRTERKRRIKRRDNDLEGNCYLLGFNSVRLQWL